MPNERSGVFDRLTVDHLVKNGTRVSWRLQPEFAMQTGLAFQLQVGESGVVEADDWVNVGSPGTDVISLINTVQQDYGAMPSAHYRVQLTLNGQIYYSPPCSCWGRLNRYDWIRARAYVRRELLRHKTLAGAAGWLFKRRKKTELIQNTDVVDFATGETIKTINNGGAGTDRVGGYFAPSFMWMDLAPQSMYPHRDNDRDMVDDIETTGRAIAYPEIEHGDVWAHATSDFRYAIHNVQILGHFRNVPIIVGMKLKQIELNDPIYELDLPPVPPLQTQNREEF